MGKWLATMGFGLVVSGFAISEAAACDPSGWTIGANEGECLQAAGDDGDLVVENTCTETLEVTVADCSGTCPQDMELSPGERKSLGLPDQAAHEDGFRLISNVNDDMAFNYVRNECPSAEGCSMGNEHPSSMGWLSTLLVAGWLVRRRRR